ncbi:PREDICTED: probable WRKY transcription factor 41 [Nelumbo nucifera]|uniref:Probable WRKY transcription factor 41 n=1 Tax=Nelumbo nucifera TaxID=4432 RepID=A0A1U8AU80_NELNU|nr:PREDICTED: probable WRKY transcription factor 41 [Nelumbo nucifera]UXG57923.1 WRKY53b [Nelumbo nucifera]
MENAGEWDKNALLNELIKGREIALKLQVLDPSSPAEMREMLVQKALITFDRALSILKRNGLETETQSTQIVAGGMVDSPRSDSASPRSDDSDRPFKDQDRRDISKKRKTLPRWTEQVRVGPGIGLEGPLDDGYSWRKYGQKDILGAKYPRGYYRCTHRNLQGCLATKQVQRSDEDPSVFDITYRGKHTCIQASHLVPASTSTEKPERKRNQDHLQPEQLPSQQNQSQEILLNFRTGLKVQTNDLDSREMISSSFSFPSTSFGCIKTENHIFSPSTLDNNFMGSYSPSFISPATSESNCFSMLPCRMNSLQGGHNLQTSESDLTEIISAATSATNSPIMDLDFSLDTVDFDTNFPFDTPGFLL